MDQHCPLIWDSKDNTDDIYSRDVRTYLKQQENLRNQLKELTLETRAFAGLRMMFQHHEQLYEEKQNWLNTQKIALWTWLILILINLLAEIKNFVIVKSLTISLSVCVL